MENLALKLKAKKIKLAAFDVDGVMTDGSLIYLSDGVEAKAFNAKDGLGISMLNKAGFKTAIITAKESNVVKERAKILDIPLLFMGQTNKKKALDEICASENLKYEEIMYMGDDLPDLEVLGLCGLSVCPSDAVLEVTSKCDFVCQKKGGMGAVREICDFLLKTHDIKFEDLKKTQQ